MPRRAPSPCPHPGCGALVDGTGYCAQHIKDKSGWNKPGRGSRQSRGYGRDWDRLRRQVMDRDHGLCQPCQRAGMVALADAVDHITPKSQGGTDDQQNLQAICNTCHKAKTARESNQ